jgi:tRNA (guanine-N7-)-methyltransferase
LADTHARILGSEQSSGAAQRGDAPVAATDASDATTDAQHPHIRSFSGRRGHFTSGQRSAYERLLQVYGIDYRNERLDPVACFGRHAPLVLEIGFGMGETTASIAAARPDTDFLGVEVYPAGVGSLLLRIETQRLGNLRIVQHDAVEVVRDMLAPDSVAGIHVFFPDPWPKARHHKRRLIRPAFVSLLASRLKPGGYLHCATDWEHYAVQMLSVLSGEPLLANTAGPVRLADTAAQCAGFAPRPEYRPQTKFERRGLRLGHQVWDVVFVRRPS